MENKNTSKTVDLKKIKPEEVPALSAEIGAQVRSICEEAVQKANAILGVYGMTAQMMIAINALKEKPKKTRKGRQSLT